MEDALNFSSTDSLPTSRSRSFEPLEMDLLLTTNTAIDNAVANNIISNGTTDVTENAMSIGHLSSPNTTPAPSNLTAADSDKGIVVEGPAPMDIAELSPTLLDPDEEEEEEEEEVIPSFVKRKRTPIKLDPEDGSYNGAYYGTPEPQAKRPRGSQKIRGILIGVWRDSDQPQDEEKHVIYGFIDVHDRLRTRIYAMNRRGEELIGNAPTGAGGCWVTFPRVIFEPHLAGQSQAVVKEYVRIRTSVRQLETDPEERQRNELKALHDATLIVQNQDTSSPSAKALVQRNNLARHQNGGRRSLPHQPLHKGASFQPVNAVAPKPSQPPETKPSGVLLGYWTESSELRPEDKHAVYGVLGGSDCFRVKVQRVTRDGRYVDGNFPVGAGALWIHYDKVIFEPHLASLTRPEVKEYTRIRQRQLENRETERDRLINELAAVREAQAIVASEAFQNGTPAAPPVRISPEMEIRHSARAEQRLAARQQAEAQAEADAAAIEQQRREKVEARERQQEATRKEVAAAENGIHETAQLELQKNLKKLNRVWVAQQAATSTLPLPLPLPRAEPAANSDEAKFYNGIKYERRSNGPFQGKYVGGAQIISIDGEDYVEYRVLTKPQ